MLFSTPAFQLEDPASQPSMQAALAAMPDILPRVAQVSEEELEESWEALAAASPSAEATEEAPAEGEEDAREALGALEVERMFAWPGAATAGEGPEAEAAVELDRGGEGAAHPLGIHAGDDSASCSSGDGSGGGGGGGVHSRASSMQEPAGQEAARSAGGLASVSGRGAGSIASSERGGACSAAAVAFGSGRLNQLRWLVWPGAPREVEQLVATQCPKVR
jgi:hypothetical protein